MNGVRRVLRGLAVAWVMYQAGTIALSPAVVWLGGATVQVQCRCAHDDHSVCPMHHPPAPDSRDCVIAATHNDGAAVLTAVLGAIGLPSSSAWALLPDPRSAVVFAAAASLIPNTSPPDPPPPRV